MAIKKLNPIVASRIAAGEVVERPASVLRELLDNSIDAGATKVSVWTKLGGIENLTVSDNGCGIEKEDLPLACISHATSKIESLDDLFSLRTLGFRGEALCSISSVSNLTISSNGYSINVNNGESGPVVPSSVSEGTTITMEGLFDNIPARKQFLKRPSSEFAECKKVFIEKALGFENVQFLLYDDNQMVFNFPATSKKERVLQILSLDKNFIAPDAIEMSAEEDPVKLYAIASSIDNYRRDRGQIKIFVNNRVIDNFPMVQVVANAFTVALPGGAFPFFYLFVEDSPNLIDFNIHPAKRECKIRNQAIVNAVVTYMIRESLKSRQKVFSYKEAARPVQNEFFASEPEIKFGEKSAKFDTGWGKQKEVQAPPVHEVKFDSQWLEKAKKIMNRKNDAQPEAKPVETEVGTVPEYQYLGQAFNTFLVVEVKDSILFIDQHAAHERILYDEIKANGDIQRLMVPYRFEVEKSVDDFLTEYSFIYSDLGVELVKVQPLVWEINTVPAISRKNEAEIAKFIQTAAGDIEQAQKGLFSVIACHCAVKAGDIVDPITAKSLVDKAFELDRMVCPHGRSFTFEITKEQLYREVGRLV